MDVEGMMNFAENLIRHAVIKANNGSLKVRYTRREHFAIGKPKEEEVIIDFTTFDRVPMKTAVTREVPPVIKERIKDDLDKWLEVDANAKALESFWHWLKEDAQNEVITVYDGESGQVIEELPPNKVVELLDEKWKATTLENAGLKLTQTEVATHIATLFEDYVENDLGADSSSEQTILRPTFVVSYPKSISPLAKASPDNAQIAERFELFINGMEVANGFSELNDPREQYERFVDQMAERERGDEEAMILDEDYIRALSYGMPPTAGIGIGIDRLTMLLTNRHSIRDVILFPHMRPEKRDEEKGREGEEENR
jgi:lysyl-tRNA synthetase class II